MKLNIQCFNKSLLILAIESDDIDTVNFLLSFQETDVNEQLIFF